MISSYRKQYGGAESNGPAIFVAIH